VFGPPAPASTAPPAGHVVGAPERGWPREPLRGPEHERDVDRGAERGPESRARQRWEESGRGGFGASTRAAPVMQPAPHPAAPPTPAPVMQLPRATPMPAAAPPAAVPPGLAVGPRPQPPQAERREARERAQPDERARVPADVRHGGREREAAR
jgi:hypothetical protein